MAKEIERKFLVSTAAWRELVEAEIHIRQFYLAASAGRTIRIRISDGASAMLTLKFSGKQRGRDEFEYPVPLAEAEEMLAFAIGRVIEKTRCHVTHQGYLYEVDVFAGALDGLVVAELETPDDVPAYRLPGWLGREVTAESRYYNASLALGEPPDAVMLAGFEEGIVGEPVRSHQQRKDRRPDGLASGGKAMLALPHD